MNSTQKSNCHIR